MSDIIDFSKFKSNKEAAVPILGQGAVIKEDEKKEVTKVKILNMKGKIPLTLLMFDEYNGMAVGDTRTTQIGMDLLPSFKSYDDELIIASYIELHKRLVSPLIPQLAAQQDPVQLNRFMKEVYNLVPATRKEKESNGDES